MKNNEMGSAPQNPIASQNPIGPMGRFVGNENQNLIKKENGILPEKLGQRDPNETIGFNDLELIKDSARGAASKNPGNQTVGQYFRSIFGGYDTEFTKTATPNELAGQEKGCDEASNRSTSHTGINQNFPGDNKSAVNSEENNEPSPQKAPASEEKTAKKSQDQEQNYTEFTTELINQSKISPFEKKSIEPTPNENSKSNSFTIVNNQNPISLNVANLSFKNSQIEANLNFNLTGNEENPGRGNDDANSRSQNLGNSSFNLTAKTAFNLAAKKEDSCYSNSIISQLPSAGIFRKDSAGIFRKTETSQGVFKFSNQQGSASLDSNSVNPNNLQGALNFGHVSSEPNAPFRG